ncbi:23S rRNA (adenine(2503)-C(2))-methyltransferase RlmN [bacterium]|nr:23S rRNA (adenine(2503)-C(2))-methyltransferase RlmN [bacterium]
MTTANPTNAADPRPALRAFPREDLIQFIEDAGFPAFRGKQVFHWLHRKGVRDIAAMKNLPADLRQWLIENTRLGGVDGIERALVSTDGSIKFLLRLRDGLKVEAVLMPGSGNNADKMTLCVSSQVGCAVDCKFCVTGMNGFYRNMTPDEIVDQVLITRAHLEQLDDGRFLRNIVYMGMGEPMLNPENVIASVRILTDQEGVNISNRRLTVSTSGIIPGLEKLAAADLGVGLAISLNSPTNAERQDIMPITRKYPLEDLLDTVARFPLRTRERVTFEYVLLGNVNDSAAHARQVAKLVKRVPCKVNVIPFNPDPALPYERPEDEAIANFQQILLDANLTASIRWSKALDVSGACGQLAGQSRQRTE